MMYDNQPRQCLWIDPAQDPSVYGGYVPSAVIEGSAGHTPLSGSGDLFRPWAWGPTLDEAEAQCAAYNETVYGLSTVDSSRIVLSSVLASR